MALTKHMVLLSFLLVTTATYASNKKLDVLCDKTSKIMEQVVNYGEVPIIIGQSDEILDHTIGVFYNKKTTSYSVLITDNNGQTCVLDSGKNLRLRYNLEKK